MSDNIISEERIKEARRIYYKNWRAKNKDKVRQHNANFWRKRAKKDTEENKDDAENK